MCWSYDVKIFYSNMWRGSDDAELAFEDPQSVPQPATQESSVLGCCESQRKTFCIWLKIQEEIKAVEILTAR